MSIAQHQGRPWTVAEVMALDEDANRYEVVDGALIVSPPPSLTHQRISHRLHTILESQVGLDMWEGVGVALDADTMVVPDLVVARKGAAYGTALLEAAEVELVVEIVSPGSRTRDRATKPALYAQAGIPLYWRIESRPFGPIALELPVLVAFELDGGEYVQTAQVDSPSTFTCVVGSDGVAFTPGELTR